MNRPVNRVSRLVIARAGDAVMSAQIPALLAFDDLALLLMRLLVGAVEI